MVALIAEIGATNARFALTTPEGGYRDRLVYLCEDFASLSDAIRAYLKDALPAAGSTPNACAVCVPGPVVADEVRLTNLGHWTFSIRQVAQEFGFEPFIVLNDFHANALAVKRLTPDEYLPLGGGPGKPETPTVVIGPGTGLGVSILTADGYAIATEGGHVTLPIVNQREADVAMALIARFGHSAAERAVSGPGLVNLAVAIRSLDGLPQVEDELPSQVMADGLAGKCPVRAEAVSLFYAFLGSVCGNLVLTTGAMGGLWLMGGILPRYPDALTSSLFQERYAAKGRFRPYLEAAPQRLVMHPHPALKGLAGLLADVKRA